ncbi:monooxygenase [Plantactinospora sp. CA-294935]|uniref:monooxygenase n=1 Tax=Plantactinospora sp. CA-294935 TaxID=3240012 RepID=UPI003D8B5861
MSGPDRDSTGRGTPGPPGDPTPVRLVTLHVWRVPSRALPRALTRMAVDRHRLRALPGVRFGKLLGTGTGTGFGPSDADLTRWAALVVWADPERAAAFDETPVGRAWRRVALAGARLDLRPLASRGRWSGAEPFGGVSRPGAEPFGVPRPGAEPFVGVPRSGPDSAAAGAAPDRPVLALTRARLRPLRAGTFWRAVPPVAAALRDAPGLLARFGIGEAPLGWQGTVSVWRNATYLRQFAYRSPEHRAAIARTTSQRWYAEELFARFEVGNLAGDPAVLGWVGSGGAPEPDTGQVVRSGRP